MFNLTNELEKVISHYLPVLERMGSDKSDALLTGIANMKKYGVESYSERVVFKSGYSSIFCTSTNWAKMNKDEKFYSDYRNHLSSELTKLVQNKTNLVSRSGDRTATPFLQALNDAGMNNSVIVHEFCEDRVKILYFTGAADDPDARDFIMNNLERLKGMREVFQTSLQNIFSSSEFMANKKMILTDDAKEIIWGNGFKNKNLIIPFKYSNLTLKEMECLKYLKFGAGNKFIADKLHISVETVKYHLANLKLKLSRTSREELIETAQSQEFANILNFLRNDEQE